MRSSPCNPSRQATRHAARNWFPLLSLVCGFAVSCQIARAQEAAPGSLTPIREIFVPFEDLNVLLEGGSRRVYLSRAEYEELLAQAIQSPTRQAPFGPSIISADYTVRVEEGRARIEGKLQIDSPLDGFQGLPLDISGLGVRSVTLDGQQAALATLEAVDPARPALLISSKGRHELLLDLVLPLETSAAQQALQCRLPSSPATKITMAVPGNVEVQSGAEVIRREVDLATNVTRFELLAHRDQFSLVMSLNNRQLREQQLIVARSVLVDEVTEAYERLHSTVSLSILHGAIDHFRFRIPPGFEVTDVSSPLLSEWAVDASGPEPMLEARFREPVAGAVVLNVSAVKTAPELGAWRFPRLEPQDVVGQVAVVGLLAEDRFQAELLAPQGLIAIDTEVLTQALPATLFAADPGAPLIRPVVAYYAPQATFALDARLQERPTQLRVTSNLLLTLEDKGQRIDGAFAIVNSEQELLSFDFTAPAGWQVLQVVVGEGTSIPIERYAEGEQGSRIHVKLPNSVPAGQALQVVFKAESIHAAWLAEWKQARATFPVFAVRGATTDMGAVAIAAHDDLEVRPESLTGLTPLDEQDKPQYGQQYVDANLAYRYESQPYTAQLVVERATPRVTARTWSFVRVENDGLGAHYELAYDIRTARTKRLSLLLPLDTPLSLSIVGMDGITLKEFFSEETPDARRWVAMLPTPTLGRVRLAVEFQQPLAEGKMRSLTLPVVVAEDVAYQSGLVAVEGNAEMDVNVTQHPRKVDVGEMVDADYQPGKRLIGAYAFVGTPKKVQAEVSRHRGYDLPPVLVERAELVTQLSTSDMSQTAARYLLRTKAEYLEIRLPDRSQLWSAWLDGMPVAPQREGKSLLISLPATSETALRDLQLVCQTKSNSQTLATDVQLVAPRLLLRSANSRQSREVPLADVVWHLLVPSGYRVLRSDGTLVTEGLPRHEPAAFTAIKSLYVLAGGVQPGYGFFAALGGSKLEHIAARGSDRSGRSYVTGEQAADSEDRRRLMPSDSAPRSKEEDGDYYEKSEDANATYDEGKSPEDPDYDNYDEADAKSAEDADYGDKADGEAEGGMGGPPGGGMQGGMGGGMAGMGVPPDGGGPGGMPGGMNGQPGPTDALAPKEGDFGVKKPNAEAKDSATEEDDAQKAAEDAKRQAAWALEGVRSLKIDLDRVGTEITFASLGDEPRLRVTLVDGRRAELLAWGVGLAVALAGVGLTRFSRRVKTRFVVFTLLISTLAPTLMNWTDEAYQVFDYAFFAGCALVVYYLLAGGMRWLFQPAPPRAIPLAPTASAMLLVACLLAPTSLLAQEVTTTEPLPRVEVPADAVLIPYDPAEEPSFAKAEKILVPYDKYVELWNLAHPDKKIQTEKPPAPFALAGASYTATLGSGEDLLITGHMELEILSDQQVTIPLALVGGVLVQADLDGKPAQLGVAEALARTASNQDGTPPDATIPPSFLALVTTGKGRHALDLAVRLRLERRGGWRVADARLPMAFASALRLQVPEARTEVRLAGVVDRATFETSQPDEAIETVLGADGQFGVQWRAQVAEAQVDRSLTARSSVLLDVQEDGLRLAWQLNLEFRRAQRESFDLILPAGYVVEKVAGANVRGWQVRENANGPLLEIVLLKPARDTESFTVYLTRRGAVGDGDLARFDAPVVQVEGSVLHEGQLSIRRSPLLALRTVSAQGASRTDLDAAALASTAGVDETGLSPLGILGHEAFRFVRAPFSVALEATHVASRTTCELQSVLRVSELERLLETRVQLDVQGRPLYQIRVALPSDLEVEDVTAQASFRWSTHEIGGRRLLIVYLARGLQGPFSLVIQGKLGTRAALESVPLPSLEVLDVERQQGQIVVQADPALDVRAEELTKCESVLVGRAFDWLRESQRSLARLALAYTTADYAGQIRVLPRQPRVHCDTFTNVRITDRSLEETVLLDFTIQEAGIREVSFLLPAGMEHATIGVPLLRQKTIEPVDAREGSPLRVRLELQDEVMDQLRVLIQNDRLLSPGNHEAPIPSVETGQTDHRYVSLESAGRDEVLIDRQTDLEPLSRGQQAWQTLADLLGTSLTQAFAARPGAARPVLEFHARDRALVETAGARIGLAQTVLTVDAAGAYRATQIYFVDNSTEQFLEIELPADATLWTSRVAHEFVKPAKVPGSTNSRRVRVPLVKTASGDRDYQVALKYAGNLGALERLRSVNFPFIRTVNIQVELSQVRLHLPPSFQWLDFGGTMRKVEDEGDLAAGYLAYQNKQLERFADMLHGPASFAQTRAANNLRALRGEVSSYLTSQSRFRQNEQLQRESARNDQEWTDAERQLVEVEKENAEQPTDDNRDKLIEVYGGQQSRRSKNVARDLGQNFEATGQGQQGAVDGKEEFSRQWLHSNRLANPEGTPDSRGGGRVQVVDRSASMSDEQAKNPSAGRPRVPGLAPLDESHGSGKGQDSQPEQTEDDSTTVSRYQKKLAKQQDESQSLDQSEPQPEGPVGGEGMPTAMPPSKDALPSDDEGKNEPLDTLAKPGYEAANMASLDIELPVRGIEYWFTTPRGDVQVSARAISRTLTARLIRLGWLLAAFVVLGVLYRWIARGGLAVLAGRLGSSLLIVLGLFSLISGVFPGVGLIGLIAGVAIKIKRRIAERGLPPLPSMGEPRATATP